MGLNRPQGQNIIESVKFSCTEVSDPVARVMLAAGSKRPVSILVQESFGDLTPKLITKH